MRGSTRFASSESGALQPSRTLSDARNSLLTRSLIFSTPATPERLVTLHVPSVCTPPFSTYPRSCFGIGPGRQTSPVGRFWQSWYLTPLNDAGDHPTTGTVRVVVAHEGAHVPDLPASVVVDQVRSRVFVRHEGEGAEVVLAQDVALFAASFRRASTDAAATCETNRRFLRTGRPPLPAHWVGGRHPLREETDSGESEYKSEPRRDCCCP